MIQTIIAVLKQPKRAVIIKSDTTPASASTVLSQGADLLAGQAITLAGNAIDLPAVAKESASEY